MKTTHKNARVALLSSFTLVAGLALAADDYPTNPERSFTTMQAPAEKSSAEVRAEFDAFRHNPVTSDGYQIVGGERGDALIQRQYAFSDGRLIVVGNTDYAAASSGQMLSAEEWKLASRDYREAP